MWTKRHSTLHHRYLHTHIHHLNYVRMPCRDISKYISTNLKIDKATQSILVAVACGRARIPNHLWRAWRVLGSGAAEGAWGAVARTCCEPPAAGVADAAPPLFDCGYI